MKGDLSVVSIFHLAKLAREDQRRRELGVGKVLLRLILFWPALFLVIGLLFGRRTHLNPCNYPGSVWSSTEPDIILIVPDGSDYTYPNNLVCTIHVDGRMIDAGYWADPRTSEAVFYDKSDVGGSGLYGGGVFDEAVLFVVEGKCTEKQYTMTIKKDFLFNGQYHIITLARDPNTYMGLTN